MLLRNHFQILKIVLKAASEFLYQLPSLSLVDFFYVITGFQKNFQAVFGATFTIIGGYLKARNSLLKRVTRKVLTIFKYLYSFVAENI
jgi:hypothetical protein